MARPLRYSHAIELTLLLWHMPDDATDSVSLKVWPNTALGCNHRSICMPQLQPLCSATLVPNVLPRKDEGLDKPCAVIERSLILY